MATDTTSESPPEVPEEEQWQAEMDANKAAQNLTAENAVPEQRPQGFLVNPNPESELTQQLREAGALPEDQEPMGKEAYDRAASKSQMKAAAKDSKSEGIMVGNMVEATKGPQEGRVFAVTRVTEFGSVADMIRTTMGAPEQLYNSPKSVEVRAIGDARDGELLVLDVEDNGLEKMNEEWRGTRAGRRH